jgi:flagella basal body P-ring formation protein FlgA
VGPDDVRLDRVELTAYPPGALFAGAPGAELPEGRITTRALAIGEPLRRDLLRQPPVVQAGDAVSVHAGGRGFEIVTDGKALAAGVDGQTIQVAVAGKVLTGTARPNKVVEIR